MAGRSRTIILALTAIVLLVVAGGLYAWSPEKPPAVLAGAVTIGGPFKLTTQDGKPLSDADLKGKPFAVFFGFTHCPEVCPTTLWEMTEALKTLGPDADRLKVLFISVDPTRDTPEFLARYLQSFDKRIVGLTGTEAEIDAVGKSYRAYWEKIPLDGGDYTMNHTASIFLMDAKGQFAGTISYGEAMDMRLGKLRKLIAGGAVS
ncbi:SCO family protein [Mesorhizobium sp. M0983]|uniref:SCO family protein n=1 Tax=Mesorhizobium sp. M0983 TaxID=2957040 RepID=UPI00333B897A